MLSLADTQNAPGIRRVLGSCSSSQDAIDIINEAASRLMRRGDWFETYIPIFVCVFNGCLVMPRYVQQVRRINFCNREIPVHNGWYEFLAYNQNYCGWHKWLSGWLGHETQLRQESTSAVFQDVQGDGRLIRAYPRCNADIGKTMRIFGLDNNGQPLITVDASGNITQGQLLTIASPFGSTNTFVRSISYIVRDPTTMIVDVYAYNATTNLLEDIGHYEPTETTPTYARYKLNINWPVASANATTFIPNCCGVSRGVVMMVKLRWIAAVNPYDLVLIPCVDALKPMIQAIQLEEKGDDAGSVQKEKRAIEILNRELENNSPDDQFALANNSLGPGVLSNQCF